MAMRQPTSPAEQARKRNNTAFVQVKAEEEGPPAKKTKTKIVFIEQPKKKLDIRYDSQTVPDNYQLVEYGNEDVTKFLLESSRKNGLPVWIANSRYQEFDKTQPHNKTTATWNPKKATYHIGRVGYYFHKGLISKARGKFKVSLRKGKLTKYGHGQATRVTPQDHEKAVSEVYPHMPERDRKTILRTLSTKTTGIGKATGSMNIYKQVELAVGAHVRHNHTDYDKIIYMSGREAARAAVEREISDKLIEWKGEDGKIIDGDETELVEFEEDSTSESSVSIVLIDDEDDDDYSPPPAGQVTEMRSRSIEPVQEREPFTTTHPDVEWLNPARPPWRNTSPLLFGSNGLDQHEFDYHVPPPQHYAPQSYGSTERPWSEQMSSQPPPPQQQQHYADSPQHRIQLRALPAVPAYNAYPPPPPPARVGTAEHFWDANRSPVRGYAPPPPPLNYSAPPTTPYAQGPHRAIQYRPLPPLGPQTERNAPAIRYRPLSPEDVLPSMEPYSPVNREHEYHGRQPVY